MTYWTCIGVETSIPWPSEEKKIQIENHQLILRPESDVLTPSIAFEHGSKGISPEEGRTIIRRFMSSLAWIERLSLREVACAGGSYPPGIGKSIFTGGKCVIFDYPYLPAPNESNKKLALALYREALGNNSVFYQFLGFVKIINIIADTKSAHSQWINSNLCHVSDQRALKKISALQTQNINIGTHVYESGRCAIAHASTGKGPVVDPDSSEDLKRLTEELPLIQSLADIVIEKKLGIQSRRSLYKEHAYELKGFREKLSNSILEDISKGIMRKVSPQEIGINLSMGIRNKTPYESMNNLQVIDAQMNMGVLSLLLSTVEGAVKLEIGLDFKNNRILMNPYAGAAIVHFGTKQSAISILGFYKFIRDLFNNGRLQIEIPNTRELLGYKDPFIPKDIDLTGTIKNLEKVIESIQHEIHSRFEQKQ